MTWERAGSSLLRRVGEEVSGLCRDAVVWLGTGQHLGSVDENPSVARSPFENGAQRVSVSAADVGDYVERREVVGALSVSDDVGVGGQPHGSVFSAECKG